MEKRRRKNAKTANKDKSTRKQIFDTKISTNRDHF